MNEKSKAQRADDDLFGVLGSEHGRRFFWRLMIQAGLYSPSFATEPLNTAFNEGRRSIALGLLAESQRVAPELYLVMVREMLNESEADAHAAKPEDSEG